jgi:hypothetical protein
MNELWTGLVRLLTPPSQSGDTACFTNVVAWAKDTDDYIERVTRVLERRNFFVVQVDKCARVPDCRDLSDELADQIHTASMQPHSCIFGTLHYYPSKPA